MSIRTKTDTAHYEAFLARPENSDRRFELIDGEIVEKMPTQLHAYIIQMLSGFLFVYLRQNPIGYALIEARYRPPNTTDNDLIPDLSFISKGHGALVQSGPALYLPDLAVEAQSDGQSDQFMLAKAQRYLNSGSRLVWLIYSTQQRIEVITPADRQLLTINDRLDGGAVLPNFSIRVGDLFPTE